MISKFQQANIPTSALNYYKRKPFWYYHGADFPVQFCDGFEFFSGLALNDPALSYIGFANDLIIELIRKGGDEHTLNEQLGPAFGIWCQPTYDELNNFNRDIGLPDGKYLDDFIIDEDIDDHHTLKNQDFASTTIPMGVKYRPANHDDSTTERTDLHDQIKL